MTDPLEALRAPTVPVDPDPVFAARLRERLRRALLEPTGGTMTTTVHETQARVRTLTPRINVDDGQHALRWYAEAFGAELRGDPMMEEDGRVGHAELAIGDSVLMLADEWPDHGLLSPKTRGGPSQSLYLSVPDVDVVFARAVELGAAADRAVSDYPYGRNGVITDPFGHRWIISSPPSPAHSRARQGDVGYASVWLPDVERAAAFYGTVLDWHSVSGSVSGGRHVEGLPHQHIGLFGGQEHRTTFLAFAVEDVHETLRRIQHAGGEAAEPTEEPFGLSAMCTDDQGMSFSIYQPPEGASPVENRLAEAAGVTPHHGEISYLTIGVPDVARAQSFYGAVLGWEFTPGHTPGGWNVQLDGTEVQPMTGIHGGADRPVVVPMYSVDDIETAVTRVREAGGTASAPEQQPYGLASTCTDDQGSHFYLAQH
ncbi:glyoxalase [Actinomadura darangshiensis]|uniref:Glyoxalase n=1 Tax=Actinomadura darangshiensis TaxID=705336 RepID=A0A4R4ZVA2_9ACTN|nr:VOC family protein [Actinomadura darangshiensis]TDD62124.1 glyoxalase [Actinomadura darangshiensis]